MNDQTLPQIGDVYRCEQCGLKISVVEPCRCAEGAPEFRCCGGEMRRGDTDETLSPEAARGDYTA